MNSPAKILLSGLLLSLASPTRAGIIGNDLDDDADLTRAWRIIIGNDPHDDADDLRPRGTLASINAASINHPVRVTGLRGQVVAIGWHGRKGSQPPQRLSAPVDLADLTLDPPGPDNTDAVLVLAGPLTVLATDDAGADLRVTLPVTQLTVALDDPDAPALHINWDLYLPLDQLAAGVQDGLLAVPEP